MTTTIRITINVVIRDNTKIYYSHLKMNNRMRWNIRSSKNVKIPKKDFLSCMTEQLKKSTCSPISFPSLWSLGECCRNRSSCYVVQSTKKLWTPSTCCFQKIKVGKQDNQFHRRSSGQKTMLFRNLHTFNLAKHFIHQQFHVTILQTQSISTVCSSDVIVTRIKTTA